MAWLAGGHAQACRALGGHERRCLVRRKSSKCRQRPCALPDVPPRRQLAVNSDPYGADSLPLHDAAVIDRIWNSSTATTSGRNAAPAPPGEQLDGERPPPVAVHSPDAARLRTSAVLGRIPDEQLTPESRQFLESYRINSRILERKTLRDLLEVVHEEREAMAECELGGINMTTALYRAAVMLRQLRANAARDAHAQYVGYVLPIFETLAPALGRKFQERVHAYDIAITLWACAAADYYNATLLRVLTNLGVGKLEEFNCTDLTHVMWGCATLNYRSAHLLLEEVALTARSRVDEFKPKELACLVWGMGRLLVRDLVLVHAAAVRLNAHSSDFGTKEVVSMLYAFARLGWVHKDGLLDAVTLDLQARLPTFVPQDFSNTLWAFSRMRFVPPPGVLDAFADTAIPHLAQFKPQELSNFVYGYGMLMHHHEALMDAVSAHACCIKGTMSDQELCVVLWSLGKIQYAPRGPVLDVIADEFKTRAATLVPLSLSNILKAYAKLGLEPRDGLVGVLTAAARRRMHQFHMAEIANLLWACTQLGHYDGKLFEAAEAHVCESLQECSWHHVSSVVSSLREMGYPAERLVSSARSYGFQI